MPTRTARKDPYNPVDAIFAAARYLSAAGYEDDVSRAIFAYNHADWYVDSVLLRARLIAGVPADLIGSLTGLTEGRFPVYARARYADDLAERSCSSASRPARTPPTSSSRATAGAASGSSPAGRPGGSGQRRPGQEGRREHASSGATSCCRTCTATATPTRTSARCRASTPCRRPTPTPRVATSSALPAHELEDPAPTRARLGRQPAGPRQPRPRDPADAGVATPRCR